MPTLPSHDTSLTLSKPFRSFTSTGQATRTNDGRFFPMESDAIDSRTVEEQYTIRVYPQETKVHKAFGMYCAYSRRLGARLR